MAFETEVRDGSGRVVGSFWTGIDREYVLPGGSRCIVPQAVAWCWDCRAYRAAEPVPSPDHIDERLRALRAGREAFADWSRSRGEHWSPYFLGDGWEGFARRELKHWESVWAWRRLRRSPPHCFECFSTDVSLLPRDAAETIHPETGQHLTLCTIAHMRLLHHWTYSVEGLPLEVERQD